MKTFTRQQTEGYIARQCGEYGFGHSIIGNTAFITTPMGSWMITFTDDNQVKSLHHGNHTGSSGYNGKKVSSQYHRQDWKDRSLPNTLWYIRNHDKGFAKPKKSRIDAIFDAIAAERAQRAAS